MTLALAYLALVVTTAFRLRQRWAFFQRLNDLHWQALVLVDIVAAFVIFWPLYLPCIIRERPLPGITISAICGGAALRGVGWAKTSAFLIDALFRALTSQQDHCRKAFLKWSAPLLPAR